MKITVVGLGCAPEALSVAGDRAIRSGGRVIYKTRRVPAAAGAAPDAQDCDDLSNRADWDAAAAARVMAAAEDADVVYCVPGDGVSDGSVAALAAAGARPVVLAAAGEAQCAPGLPLAAAYTVADAGQIPKMRRFDTDRPLVVRGIAAGEAERIRAHLLKFWSAATPVRTAGGETTLERREALTPPGAEGAAVLLPLPLRDKTRFGFGDLLAIMDVLTGPDGCPWDRAQTHASIRGNLIEEAYEAADAVDRGSIPDMIEEMGDVLLQAVFHGVIAQKSGEFDCGDILDNLCAKLLFRHPHVFGAVKARDAESALGSWEAAKAVEKRQDTLSAALDSIPKAFPQTLRAAKVGRRAAKAGIGAQADAALYLEVLGDRLAAFGAAKDRERTIGECFYALANLARVSGVDPEVAAAKVVDGYVERFRRVEEKLAAQGISVYAAEPAALEGALIEAIYEESRGR